MTHIPKNSHAKIRRLHDEGFTLSELAIMYSTTQRFIESVLE